MASIKTAYGTAVTGTGGIHSLGSSSTWVAGYEWFIVDNTTELALSWLLRGGITVGTTPTSGTEIRIYLFASYDGSTWAVDGTIDGTASAETMNSEGVRDSYGKLAAVIRVDSTTSNRTYDFSVDVASFFGGVMPKKVSVFVTHNTGVNLNSTSGNQTYAAQPVYATSA